MQRKIDSGPSYIQYTLDDHEFKSKLGINDPNPVLEVNVDMNYGAIAPHRVITVTMSNDVPHTELHDD